MAEDSLPPHSLRLVCKGGKAVTGYAELVALASPVLADMISVARTGPAPSKRQKTTRKGSASAASSSAGPQSGAGTEGAGCQREDGVIELQCPEDSADDWEQLLVELNPFRRDNDADAKKSCEWVSILVRQVQANKSTTPHHTTPHHIKPHHMLHIQTSIPLRKDVSIKHAVA